MIAYARPAMPRIGVISDTHGLVRPEALRALAETEVVKCAGRALYVLHDLHELDLDPRAAGFDAVIAGHSHQPRVERRDGVLYLNPGSAGPRRFRLPVCVARLSLNARRLDARIVTLDV